MGSSTKGFLILAVALIFTGAIVAFGLLGPEGLNRLFWTPPKDTTPPAERTYVRPTVPPAAKPDPQETELLCALIEDLQNPPEPFESYETELPEECK